MRLYLVILLSCFSYGLTIGQDRNVDSLSDSLQKKQFAESSHQKVDSIRQVFYQQSNSLKSVYVTKFAKMDSTQSRLEGKLDSIRSSQTSFANSSRAKVDSVQLLLQNKLDGLSISSQTSRLTNAIDSIKHLRDSTLMNLNKNMQVIKDKLWGN